MWHRNKKIRHPSVIRIRVKIRMPQWVRLLVQTGTWIRVMGPP